jgi:site-specific DNA-methyltransferase (adenine-specific)
LLAFGGTRTCHRMVCAVEDAEFEIRDSLMWVYGSGFPKSHNLGDGRGTALKPSHEPIVLARKPLESTVAANVAKWGTGALNVDGCRVSPGCLVGGGGNGKGNTGGIMGPYTGARPRVKSHSAGRWPSNTLLSHSPDCQDPAPCVDGCPAAETDRQSGASRFFSTFRYQAKAPKSERPSVNGVSHPTVKPLALVRWLVRLVTLPGGVVLDPFAGTGTTLEAAVLEGVIGRGIESDPACLPWIEQRLERVRSRELELF